VPNEGYNVQMNYFIDENDMPGKGQAQPFLF
jgi:hypothetical protein